MNITEANAVNDVLYWVLGTPDSFYQRVSNDQACEQAAWLADRASRALSAGLTGEQLKAQWPNRQRR